MLYYKHGDLLTSDCDVILHQTNCFSITGSGIAKSIKMQFPEAYIADFKSTMTPEEKLGNFTVGYSSGKYIYNIYGQYNINLNSDEKDYSALYSGLDKAFAHIKENLGDVKIGAPYRMACGLAGGDWKIVKRIFRVLCELHDISLHIYKL